jgi:hypothetical protein
MSGKILFSFFDYSPFEKGGQRGISLQGFAGEGSVPP